jgi:glutathione S-transferase
MEQLVIFVPALFLFGHYVSSGVGALVGLGFVVGREMYAMGYIKDASKRGPGFLVTVVCQAILVVGALVGVLRAIL